MRLTALCLSLGLIVLVQGTAWASPCGKTLQIKATEEYAPFIFKGEDGAAAGMDVTLIRQVLAQIGCDFEFVYLPWKRAMLELEAGRIDMVPTGSFRQERLSFARFSPPYRYETIGFVMRRGEGTNWPATSLRELAGLSVNIGSIRGAYRGDAFEAFVADGNRTARIVDVNFTSQAVKLLLAGRIDLYVETAATVLFKAEELGLGGQLEEHPLVLESEPVHFMFSRKTVSEATMGLVEERMKMLMQDEDYQLLFGNLAIHPRPAS